MFCLGKVGVSASPAAGTLWPYSLPGFARLPYWNSLRDCDAWRPEGPGVGTCCGSDTVFRGETADIVGDSSPAFSLWEEQRP